MEPESDLIARVQAGDRGAIEEFVRRYEPLIRARFREQFAATPNRSMYSTSKFFDTVLRRVGSVLSVRGSVSRLGSPTTVLEKIIAAAASDYKRSMRIGRTRNQAPYYWDVKSLPPNSDTSPAALSALSANLDKTDIEILRMRMSGTQHRDVASAVGMSIAAVRMRWHRIMNKFRQLRQHEEENRTQPTRAE